MRFAKQNDMKEPVLIKFRDDLRPEDSATVQEMLESTGFFYEAEIPVALEIIQERLEKGSRSDYFFLFAEVDEMVVAYSNYGPIMGTESSFDLYWIAAHRDFRGKGIGKLLLEKTHQLIRQMGGKRVIAETSALEKYLPTRNFYESMGYFQAGFIADFYKPGDGKITYVKTL